MADYQKCEAAEKMAGLIIPEHHPHLVGATIAYLLKICEKPNKKRFMKAFKLATASRPSDKILAAIPAVCDGQMGPDFIIEIQSWAWAELLPEEQRALIDHELMHCKQDLDGFYIADHDLEEFNEIVARHGAWRPNVRRFLETGQGKLFDHKAGDDTKVEISYKGRKVKTTGRGLRRAAKALSSKT